MSTAIETWTGGVLRPISTTAVLQSTAGSTNAAVSLRTCSDHTGELHDVVHTTGGETLPNLRMLARLKSALMTIVEKAPQLREQYAHALVDVRKCAPRVVLRPENQTVCVQRHTLPFPDTITPEQALLALVPLWSAAFALAQRLLRLPRDVDLGLVWLRGEESWTAEPVLRSLWTVVPVSKGADHEEYGRRVWQCIEQNMMIVYDVVSSRVGSAEWSGIGPQYSAGTHEFLLSELFGAMKAANEGKMPWEKLLHNISTKWLASFPPLKQTLEDDAHLTELAEYGKASGWAGVKVHHAETYFGCIMTPAANKRARLVWVCSDSFAGAVWRSKSKELMWAPAPPAAQPEAVRWAEEMLQEEGQQPLPESCHPSRYVCLAQTGSEKLSIMWEDETLGRVTHMLHKNTITSMQIPLSTSQRLNPWVGGIPATSGTAWRTLWGKLYDLPLMEASINAP